MREALISHNAAPSHMIVECGPTWLLFMRNGMNLTRSLGGRRAPPSAADDMSCRGGIPYLTAGQPGRVSEPL